MIDFRSRSIEAHALVNAILGILIVAVFSKVEWLRFGTFAQMAGAFIVADVLVYIATKFGWIKRRSGGHRA